MSMKIKTIITAISFLLLVILICLKLYKDSFIDEADIINTDEGIKYLDNLSTSESSLESGTQVTSENMTTIEDKTTEVPTTQKILKVLSIKAEYYGSSVVGEATSSADFHVYADYDDGSNAMVNGWYSEEVGKKLTEGENLFRIGYNDPTTNKVFEYEVKVTAYKRVVATGNSYIASAVNASKAQETLNAMNAGTLSTNDIFADGLVMGDSVATGFPIYGFVYATNAIAQVSAGLGHLQEHMGEVLNIAPKKIFFYYGINSISLSDDVMNSFVADYKSLLLQLKSTLPNTRLIVGGLLPSGPDALARNPRFGRTAAYNAALYNMCKEIGIDFYDGSALAGSYNDEYVHGTGGDGIHLTPDFYGEWLRDMIKTMCVY